jgi:hypothetical protein
MIRMPDALEANIQKATDLGVLGIVMPTVDDALEARDAARFSRYPPFGRRSSGAGTASGFWGSVPGGYRATINDNFLVVVMLETLESIINADEIANTFGLDARSRYSDLSQFSGWSQTENVTCTCDDQPQRHLEGREILGQRRTAAPRPARRSAPTRVLQNGPSHDCFAFPQRGRARPKSRAHVIGVPVASSPREAAAVAVRDGTTVIT